MVSKLVVSFPKSGRTWVRYMLGALILRMEGRQGEDAMLVESEFRDRYGCRFTHLGGDVQVPLAQGSAELSTLYPDGVPSLGIRITKNIYAALTSYYYHARYRWKATSARNRWTSFSAIRAWVSHGSWRSIARGWTTGPVGSSALALRPSRPVESRPMPALR